MLINNCTAVVNKIKVLKKNFDFIQEIEQPLVDWLIISCKPRPSSRVLIA